MSEKKQSELRQRIQLIWGFALAAMGFAFFFRVSEVMNRIGNFSNFSSNSMFIRVALYLVAIILIAGGAKKIHSFFNRTDHPGE